MWGCAGVGGAQMCSPRFGAAGEGDLREDGSKGCPLRVGGELGSGAGAVREGWAVVGGRQGIGLAGSRAQAFSAGGGCEASLCLSVRLSVRPGGAPGCSRSRQWR